MNLWKLPNLQNLILFPFQFLLIFKKKKSIRVMKKRERLKKKKEKGGFLYMGWILYGSDFLTPWTVPCQAPLFMEFSRQEYWSGLPFPSPGDLPDPGIKPGSSEIPFLHMGRGEQREGEGRKGKARIHVFLRFLSLLLNCRFVFLPHLL